MPTRDDVNHLIDMLKQIKEQNRTIRLPSLGEQSSIPLESVEKPVEAFRVTINRKQRIIWELLIFRDTWEQWGIVKT